MVNICIEFLFTPICDLCSLYFLIFISWGKKCPSLFSISSKTNQPEEVFVTVLEKEGEKAERVERNADTSSTVPQTVLWWQCWSLEQPLCLLLLSLAVQSCPVMPQGTPAAVQHIGSGTDLAGNLCWIQSPIWFTVRFPNCWCQHNTINSNKEKSQKRERGRRLKRVQDTSHLKQHHRQVMNTFLMFYLLSQLTLK